eukprot:EG_transcript_20241
MAGPSPSASPSSAGPSPPGPGSRLLTWQAALGAALVAVLCLFFSHSRQTPTALGGGPVQPGRVSPEGLPVFTVDELAQYDGRQPGGLLYLAVLGEVFDVTSGAQHYQEGTGYHCFVGRDASAAFMTGKFEGDGLTSDVADLTPDGLQAVLGWRDFYRKHESYRKVGVLAERYFDLAGRPTAAWHEMDRRRQEVEAQALRRELLLKRYKDCNSKSVMDEPYFTVWCEAGEPQRYIRELVIKPLLPTGQEERRCACAAEAQFADEGIRRYPDCGPLAVTCQRSRTTG